MAPSEDQDLEALLAYLKRNRGFDFTGYKRASLARRIEKRMTGVNTPGYAEYLDYLEVHPDEFAALFNTILINVTSFFRDEAAWEFLASQVLPDLVAQKGRHEQIRVWSAGCASGEEAYTLAMLFGENMGIDQVRERVKIYATDIDEDALNKARHGAYTEHEVEAVPVELRKKYFDIAEGQYLFRKDLRRQVIFGRHDLIDDAPISRVDMLVCRNTLMYLNSETQAKILGRFHFALNDGGILFLGRAETLLTHETTFHPIDLKRRISVKKAHGARKAREALLHMANDGEGFAAGSAVATHLRLRDIALAAAPVAQLVVDATGMLVVANDRARSLFAISANDLGRPLQDLKVSYRPVELRSLLEQTSVERRPVALRSVEWQSAPGDARFLDLEVVPLLEGGVSIGTTVTFTDVTASLRLHRQLEAARTDLETAYEELQSTNEELETTNEELQSTVEELETTNEELQSTNEELETMNEELQASNEELHTINDELRERGDELNQVNGFLDSVLAGMRGGVVVVDSELQVLVWNRGAQDMWGLRPDEAVGTHFLALDIGLPVDQLKQPLRACLAGEHRSAQLEVEAINRRGRKVTCHVDISPLHVGQLRQQTDGDGTRGAILVMEDGDHGRYLK